MKSANPYKMVVERNLPRVLALFDTDKSSDSYGFGDRFHWAWNLIDFGNGTFQGVAHGLARLIQANILPEWISEESILARIDAMFSGADILRRADGSMEEAFPYEGSFCVTALVAYDLLTTIELLEPKLSSTVKQGYLNTIRPMIAYLHKADEKHAFISNHLATAVAALYKWSKLTGEEGSKRGGEILDRILSNQSSEGWYLEYDGADPGYQSLCTYYLADVLQTTQDEKLKQSLQKSVEFLQYFAHPDGSFGGVYGSRNTRFYYPAGVEYLASDSEPASILSQFMRISVGGNRVVGLDAIDEPNLVPMFNAYCWAAALNEQHPGTDISQTVPSDSDDTFRIDFKGAGLILDKGKEHYSIVSVFKGGVVYHFRKGKLKILDAGSLFTDSRGTKFSTQSYNKTNKVNISNDSITIESSLTPFSKKRFQPWQMVILRMMNLTVMRTYSLRELVKKVLVKLLITGSASNKGTVSRNISFGENLQLEDSTNLKVKLTKLSEVKNFVAIHMASKGYWQKQDTE